MWGFPCSVPSAVSAASATSVRQDRVCLLHMCSQGQAHRPDWDPGKQRDVSDSPHVSKCACLSVLQWPL